MGRWNVIQVFNGVWLRMLQRGIYHKVVPNKTIKSSDGRAVHNIEN